MEYITVSMAALANAGVPGNVSLMNHRQSGNMRYEKQGDKRWKWKDMYGKQKRKKKKIFVESFGCVIASYLAVR